MRFSLTVLLSCSFPLVGYTRSPSGSSFQNELTIQAVVAPTVRSAAFPSHSGGMEPFFHFPPINCTSTGRSFFGSVPIRFICPNGNGFRSFSIIAECQTRTPRTETCPVGASRSERMNAKRFFASRRYSIPDQTPQTSTTNGHARASSMPTLNAVHHNHTMRGIPLDYQHFSQADP